ncbi:MAG: hypothetical protein HYX86_02455 [Chloroflexi bacterium]|nr:hypothetical protein [Chloroflexota bacterium]
MERRDLAKIESWLLERLEQDPQAGVNLIVRTRGQPQDHLPFFSQKGIEVRHQIQLLKALAIHGPAGKCLSLLEEDWVLAIEEDRPVKALFA